jgi:transcriptional regulator with XRE-family HTH domain
MAVLSVENIVDKKTEKTIAQRLDHYRQTLGLGYNELAAPLFASRALVTKVLRGKRHFPMTEQLLFFTALGVDATRFYSQIQPVTTTSVEYEQVKLKGDHNAVRLAAAFSQVSFAQAAVTLNQLLAEYLADQRAATQPKLTMREVGEQLKVSHSFIGKIEKCDRRVKFTELCCLAGVYG